MAGRLRLTREWAAPRFWPTPFVAASSALVAAGLAVIGWRLLRWGLVDAVWSAPQDGADAIDLSACQGQAGACWAAVGARYRFVLFGYYPFSEQWRPALASLLVLALYAVSAPPRHWRLALGWAWLAGLAAAFCLIRGGILGMETVAPDEWGGLPLVLLLSTGALAAAVPLGVLLALARRSRYHPLLKTLSLGYVEVCRGIPLVTVLFFSSIMLPMFLPVGWSVPKLVRAQLAIALFTTAYLSEVVRSGLEVIPRGQAEAADALGLSAATKIFRVLLPQALRLSIPGLVNGGIGLFKNSSIVSIIGMFDLVLTAQTVLADPVFAPYYLEVYLFVGAIYAAFCLAMSRYSRFLEARFGTAGHGAAQTG